MDKSLYIAMTGASSNLRRQATVANNLANTSTPGFKEMLAGTIAVPVEGPGLESRVAASARTFGVSSDAGAVIPTGNPLDIALRDNTWLTVQDSQGRPAYTRAGDMKLNANGQLLTGAGRFVLDSDGNPMAIPPYQSIDIASDGTISIVPEGETAANSINVGRLGVVSGTTADLELGDDGLMRPRPGVAALQATDGQVLTSGAVEGSNTNPAGALVEMIQISRQYEMAVKVLEKGDENARASNSLISLR